MSDEAALFLCLLLFVIFILFALILTILITLLEKFVRWIIKFCIKDPLNKQDNMVIHKQMEEKTGQEYETLFLSDEELYKFLLKEGNYEKFIRAEVTKYMNGKWKIVTQKDEEMRITFEQLKCIVGDKYDVNKLFQIDKNGERSLVDGIGLRKKAKGVYDLTMTEDLLKKIQ